MKVLFIGDVFGRPGRHFLADILSSLIKKHKIDFVIANIENAAGGRGITEKTATELFELPLDAGTGGNHIWEQKNDIKKVLKNFPIARPMNIKGKNPGKGFLVLEKGKSKIAIVSLQGKVFMDDKGIPAENAFVIMDDFLKREKLPKTIIVDFHAEATAEKRALLWYLNGKITALLGTHTHVQTADEEVTNEGTAYITDVGMTGPHRSVIGMDKERAIERFIKGTSKSLQVSKEGVRLEAVLLDIDERTGRSQKITRLQIREEE